MTEAVAASDVAASANEANGQPQQQGWFGKMIGMAFRMYLMMTVMKWFTGNKSTPAAPSTDSTTPNQPAPQFAGMNSFQFGEKYQLFLHLTDEENFDEESFKSESLFQKKIPNLTFGNWEEEVPTVTKKISLPDSVMLFNKSLHLHTFMTPSGFESPFSAPDHKTRYEHYQVTPYKKLVKYKRTANLITGSTDIKEEDILDDPKLAPIIPHYHPNISINVLYDVSPFKMGQLPDPMGDYYHFKNNGRFYTPVVIANPYWNMARDYFPLNDTTPTVDFTLTVYPLSMWKFQMYASQLNTKNNWMKEMMGQDTDGSDSDVLKEMLLETNIYLVATTFIVSILHMIFELLAFKNEIQFWNSKKEGKNLEGLSIRSVLTSIVQSVIVFLYILDNEANFMVLMNVFVGMLIDFWKIGKVLKITKIGSSPTQPTETVETTNKSEDAPKKQPWSIEILGYNIQEYEAYQDSPTKEYDRMAFRYLGYIIFPLFIGYGVYSIIYQEHRGWYSFILGMFYGFLLVFGFIMMTPQLFINYKLKSTAHLPWRMMTYKFINTFIDDLFAFVIKMPTMYRLGCFRDDIVFLVFLYQKWIYKTDYSRTNEFGVTGESAVQENQTKSVEDKKNE